jgi:hypothetical protein
LALTTDAYRLIVHIGKNNYFKSIAVLDARATLELREDGASEIIEDGFKNYINVLNKILKENENLEELPEDKNPGLQAAYSKFTKAYTDGLKLVGRRRTGKKKNLRDKIRAELPEWVPSPHLSSI